MAKYIPENARWADITPLLDEIDSGLKHMRYYDERDDYSDFLAEEREDLLRLPMAEPNAVRVVAHWVFGSTKGHSWMKCSNCLHSHEWQTAIFNYCPICGARMSEDVEYGYN